MSIACHPFAQQAEQQAAQLQGHADGLEALIGGTLLEQQGQPADARALIDAEIAALTLSAPAEMLTPAPDIRPL